MISITERAAKLLRDKIADAIIKAGSLDMTDINPEITQMLKERLIKVCFETGIGFRILVTSDGEGNRRFIIKIDKVREDDETLEIDGIRLFADTLSAIQISNRQLDYFDESQSGFTLI